MKSYLQNIYSLILQNEQLNDEAKQALLKSLAEADKQWTITDFKLDRTEKVKHTTAVLLEETIEELEQKRKAIEVQNRELEIESSLERVRTVAMSMNKADDMLDVCRSISHQLELLAVKEIRNVQTAIFYEAKGTYMNYEYYAKHDKTFITETTYTNNEIHEAFAQKMLKGNGEFFITHINGDEVKDWVAYQKTTNVFIDDYLYTASSLNYYWFSLGPVALGISTYSPLSEENIDLFKRFRNVFELSYKRYLDIEQAEAQARESQIQLALERVRARTMAMQKSDELQDTAALLFQQANSLGVIHWSCGFNIYDDDGQATTSWMASEFGKGINSAFKLPLNEHIFKDIYEAAQRGESLYIHEINPAAIEAHYRYMFTIPVAGDRLKAFVASGGVLPTIQILHVAFFSRGYLLFITLEPVPGMWDIYKRFAKVFEQTYTRFLDLQKAEAQAREAQVQLSLERVRARTMAMHKSAELAEVVYILFQQFKELGENPDQATVGIINEDEGVIEYWVTMYGNQMNRGFKFSIDEPHVTHKIYQAWKAGEKSVVIDLSGKELREFMEYRASMGGAAVNEKETRRIINVAFFSKGLLNVQSNETRSAESINLLERFAAVFEQTYTRFLDLQKAEAQARESQVQLALERVRARTMAMHKSDELLDVITDLSRQLVQLNLKFDNVSFGENNQLDDFKFWLAAAGMEHPMRIEVPYLDNPAPNRVKDAQKKGIKFFADILSPEENREWMQHLIDHSDLSLLPEKVKNYILNSVGFARSTFLMKNINLYVANYKAIPYTDEENQLLFRFAQVFEQSYVRFLDLQKAEAQARESKIEAALEKVRARAMAMQKPNELIDVAQLLRKEMGLLGVEELETSSIYIHNEGSALTECWFAIKDIREGETKVVADHMTMQLNDTWVGREMLKFYTSGQKQISILMQGGNRKEWINYCSQHSKLLGGYYGKDIPDRTYHLLKFSNGYMGAASPGNISAESWDLLRRATAVFSLAYTRFSDLQLAEARAREAMIEAALERVRAQAMAMHKTEDLSSAVATVFEEMDKLDLGMTRCGIGILDKERRSAEVWTAHQSQTGNTIEVSGNESMDIHPLLQGAFNAWLRQQEDFCYVLQGEDMIRYYQAVRGPNFTLPESELILSLDKIQKQYYCVAIFKAGGLFAFRETEFPEEAKKLIKRFANVFDLTYTRFLDLQKAEANAREAMKRAALDRIRADIASMRTVNDLNRITPLIWNELTILGISFIRCGVFIMDQEGQLIHTFLSTPDGKAIAAFNLPFNTPGNFRVMLDHWFDKKIYIDHWNRGDFNDIAEILVNQGAIGTKEQYITSLPAQGFYLNFLPFLQGMLYVGNTEKLSEEQIELIRQVAEAFSTAYARYEDFNKLEVAKQQIERTYSELKSAQAQLIQSEKMASLGELTAGIAHEIQNPLNFVNNFSEVNGELVDELKAQLATGNLQLATEIADDLKENENKILHHGKRADAIVKGMLQHTRVSAGQKEPTDINALADEYLRLSYHGMRAKDKSFNAEIKTDFDESISKINVVPQDIGRVLLNLYNNAFYAVMQKQKDLTGSSNLSGLEPYHPIVSVTTKALAPSLLERAGGEVEIRISDNGQGIPQNIVDKIFQPFFTTKPTGEGTGLGLSLAYDIIKAHGGVIRVETNESEGSKFIIQL